MYVYTIHDPVLNGSWRVLMSVLLVSQTTYDLHKAGESTSSADDLRCTESTRSNFESPRRVLTCISVEVYEMLASPQDWAENAIQLSSFAETIANETPGNATAGSKRSPATRPRAHEPRQNPNASDPIVSIGVQAFTT
jgi:hypothetical protein